MDPHNTSSEESTTSEDVGSGREETPDDRQSKKGNLEFHEIAIKLNQLIVLFFSISSVQFGIEPKCKKPQDNVPCCFVDVLLQNNYNNLSITR